VPRAVGRHDPARAAERVEVLVEGPVEGAGGPLARLAQPALRVVLELAEAELGAAHRARHRDLLALDAAEAIEVEARLGEGSAAQVWLVRHRGSRLGDGRGVCLLVCLLIGEVGARSLWPTAGGAASPESGPPLLSTEAVPVFASAGRPTAHSQLAIGQPLPGSHDRWLAPPFAADESDPVSASVELS
jgi:hypothetical protein